MFFRFERLDRPLLVGHCGATEQVLARCRDGSGFLGGRLDVVAALSAGSGLPPLLGPVPLARRPRAHT